MLRVIKFGRNVGYLEALNLQEKLVLQKLTNRPSEPDYLIILEHEPCITLGRRSHTELINSTIPIFKSPRGGRVTYHGPGQLTCYPIIDLKRQPKLSLECYVQQLSHVMIDSLSSIYNLNNLFYDNDPERVGLWLPQSKKIGFIGIQARKWITSHGFSINLKTECLAGFNEIDPCGLRNQNVQVTCAEIETENLKNDSSSFSDELIKKFSETFYNKAR